MPFAENTTVSSERSKAEIEETLRRYGASEFVSGWAQDRAQIGFKAKDRYIRFRLIFPNPDDKKFTHKKTRYGGLERRTEVARNKEYEQEIRRLWRAMCLCIKAKLEAVQSGISTFEDEFMAWVVMPNGMTLGEVMQPQIAAAYTNGKMPPLLGYNSEHLDAPPEGAKSV